MGMKSNNILFNNSCKGKNAKELDIESTFNPTNKGYMGIKSNKTILLTIATQTR